MASHVRGREGAVLGENCGEGVKGRRLKIFVPDHESGRRCLPHFGWGLRARGAQREREELAALGERVYGEAAFTSGEREQSRPDLVRHAFGGDAIGAHEGERASARPFPHSGVHDERHRQAERERA